MKSARVYVPFWLNTQTAVTSYRACPVYGSCDGGSTAGIRENVGALELCTSTLWRIASCSCMPTRKTKRKI